MEDTKPLAFIIEDEEFLADIFTQTLQDAGFETKAINDGEVAMQQLARSHPDLVVLDLHLPKYSGTNIFDFIWSSDHLKKTWTIVATADASSAADLRTVYDEKKSRLIVLIKPISVTDLKQLALKLIDIQKE